MPIEVRPFFDSRAGGRPAAYAARVRLKLVTIALVAVLGSGCATEQFVVVTNDDPIDTEVLGPVFARPDAPPLECRDIPREACINGGNLDEAVFGVPIEQVARVVLSCQSPRCDNLNGDYRIDAVLRDGSTINVGSGGYSTSQ